METAACCQFITVIITHTTADIFFSAKCPEYTANCDCEPDAIRVNVVEKKRENKNKVAEDGKSINLPQSIMAYKL